MKYCNNRWAQRNFNVWNFRIFDVALAAEISWCATDLVPSDMDLLANLHLGGSAQLQAPEIRSAVVKLCRLDGARQNFCRV